MIDSFNPTSRGWPATFPASSPRRAASSSSIPMRIPTRRRRGSRRRSPKRSSDRLRLYPDPMATEFRRTAAELHGVEPDMVLAGNGSDDLLTIITRAFVGPGDLAAYPSPSYLLYSTLIALQDGRRVVVPYTSDWTLEKQCSRDPGLEALVPGQPR